MRIYRPNWLENQLDEMADNIMHEWDQVFAQALQNLLGLIPKEKEAQKHIRVFMDKKDGTYLYTWDDRPLLSATGLQAGVDEKGKFKTRFQYRILAQ